LPPLARNSRQDAVLDRAEIATHQPGAEGGADDGAGNVTGNRQRRAQFAHLGRVTGEDRGDRRVQVLGLRLLEVLRLEQPPAPAAGRAPVETARVSPT